MILGPPGCGKTHALLERLQDELDEGVRPERIAFVAFTRAARGEAQRRVQDRFGLGASRLPWLRTIHSASFKLLELAPDRVMGDEQWSAFAERHHYRLAVHGYGLEAEPDAPYVPVVAQPDDALHAAYEWGRNRLLTPDQTLGRFPGADRILVGPFRQFVDRLEAFKVEHRLLDFPDLLDQVLVQGLRPDVDVAFIDEAHDLCPLQIAVVEMWFADCVESYVAADDDQAIYTFQGAEPSWVLELAQRRTPQILTQSRRVPARAHALAMKIIGANRERLEKDYLPADRPGEIVRCDLGAAVAGIDVRRSTFVLVRNRRFMQRVAATLIQAAVPFLVEGKGAGNAYSKPKLIEAARLAVRLWGGGPGPYPASSVEALLDLVPVASGIVSDDARRVVKAMRGEGSFTSDELLGRLGLAALIERIGGEGPISVLSGATRSDQNYLSAVVDRFGDIPEPEVRLTTIHASKGRQAALVVVVPDMSRLTYDAYMNGGQRAREAENRVFYVAVTRTEQALVLVQPSTRRFYVFPSLEGGAA